MRPAVHVEDPPVEADQSDGLVETAESVERIGPPNERGGGDEVGLDTRGARGRYERPVGLGAVTRARGSTMWCTSRSVDLQVRAPMAELARPPRLMATT